MNVLSLFDGMSCGRIALDRLGVKVDNYFASEIDKNAIKVSKDNWQDVTHIGDVTKVSYKDGILYTENGNFAVVIDLLIGGSPCQGFSFAGKQVAFNDIRSKLYFEYERLLDELKAVNPDVTFLLENVRMKQEHVTVITKRLGVTPIAINSELVSAQSRYRLYWTNIDGITQPDNLRITLSGVMEDCGPFKFKLGGTKVDGVRTKNYLQWDLSGKGNKSQSQRAYYPQGKCGTLDCVGTSKVLLSDGRVRLLTRGECESLQTVPLGYTNSVSSNAAKKMLGNGWTVDVITHILSGMKNKVVKELAA